MSEQTTYPAVSGTYTIHRTLATPGTPSRRVKPICGQSTRQSYISVITEDWATQCVAKGLGKLCKKCH